VRELWRSGNKKRRKGIGCRKRQKIRRQARRVFNAALASSLAREWRRRRSRERSAARRLLKAWRRFKNKKAKKEECEAEMIRRRTKVKAAMLAGVGACPNHTGCFCVLWNGDWFAPPEHAENNNSAAVDRPRKRWKDREISQAKVEPELLSRCVGKIVSPAKGKVSEGDGSPIEHKKKRKKKNKKPNKKGR